MKKKLKETKGGRFLIGLGRGLIKCNPFGAALVEGIENIKAPKDEKLPHRWVSIAVQLIGTACIVYAFATKQITVDQVLHYLDIPTVESIYPADSTLQNETRP